MSFAESTLQNIVNGGAQVLGCGNQFGELGKRIEVLVIKDLEDFAFHEAVEVEEIADHTGLRLDVAADRDLESVVVAVSIRIVAFAVGDGVFRIGHAIAMQTMGGAEAISPCEIGLHSSP